MDITYIPMARGFDLPQRPVVMDWASRRVLSSTACRSLSPAPSVSRDRGGGDCEMRLSGDLQHGPEAIAVYDAPPSPACSTRTASRSAWMAKAAGATTSLVERLWRHDQIRRGLPARLRQRRRDRGAHALPHPLQHPPADHSSLADQTPDEAYFTPALNSESGVAPPVHPLISLARELSLYRKAEPLLFRSTTERFACAIAGVSTVVVWLAWGSIRTQPNIID